MKTIDNVFYRDFRDMMNTRRGITTFNYVDIPLPELKTMLNGTPKGYMATVKGIKEPFFERLNGEEVQLVGRTTLKKRQVLSDGSFRKDSKENFVYTQIPVKHDCVAILSRRSVGLKRFVEVNGMKKEHKVSEGFRYVDYIETENGRKYIYIVPKTFVYRLSLCALVLTPNKHRVYYKGCKLALQNGNYIYLHVIPFKFRENLSYRVLGVKAGFDFDTEVNQILRFWTEIGVIFDPKLTALEGTVSGVTNLGIMDLEGTCSLEDYVPYTVSLADEKEERFENSLLD